MLLCDACLVRPTTVAIVGVAKCLRGFGKGPWSKILPELVDVASDGKQVTQNARRLWAGLVKLWIHKGSNACWKENTKLPARGVRTSLHAYLL